MTLHGVATPLNFPSSLSSLDSESHLPLNIRPFLKMAFSAGKVPNFFEGASETPTFFQEIDIPFKEIAGDTGRIGGPTSRSSANMATIQPEVENGDSVVKLPSFMTFVNSVKRGEFGKVPSN